MGGEFCGNASLSLGAVLAQRQGREGTFTLRVSGADGPVTVDITKEHDGWRGRVSMAAWARENAASSGLADAPIRWIVDDCAKFVEREIRRGRRYDALIMDPPSYGRGPSGEIWKLEENLWPFVRLCADALSDDPLFVLINSYTTGLAPSVLTYMTESIFARRFGGHSASDELGLPVTDSGLALPCGASCRWSTI